MRRGTMAEQIFIRILNMSLTGSFVILMVLVMRLLLRRMPKIFSYCLWAVVLFRLLCPVSFSAGFSPFGVLKAPAVSHGRMEYIPEDIMQIGWNEQQAAAPEKPEGNVLSDGGEPAPAQSGTGSRMESAVKAGCGIWLAGVAVMAAYSLVSLVRLKRRLKTAVREKDNLYVTTKVATPFVIGIWQPRIYLPAILDEEERGYVLLHEQIHLKRKDHIIKNAAFIALCLHWFNPLVWAAFFLSGKDMEMSCDEAVIRKIGSSVKKEYSTSLLSMATGRHIVSGVPLAFGEGDTGSRIKNVLRYKKPAAIGVGIAAAACAVLTVFLLANPGKEKEVQTGEVVRYYGVVADVNIEGDTRRLLVIPGIGEVDIPAAESVYPYFEREEQGLIPGDMVVITFPQGKEVAIQESYPARFSESAESIVVLWESCALESIGNNRFYFTFPGGVVPEVSRVEIGEALSIYWEEGAEENWAYLPVVPDSENSRLIAVSPILAVGERDGVKVLTIELSANQLQSVFAGFGYHIRFESGLDGNISEEEIRALQDEVLAEQIRALQEEVSTRQDELSSMQGGTKDSLEGLGGLQEGKITGEGSWRVSVRSVARSARVIDAYMTAWDNSYDGGEPLALAEDCVFKANYSMDGIDLREISYDEFADLIGEGPNWMNKPCILTFQDGLVVEAVLESAWVNYGIYFSRFSPGSYLYEFLMEEEGEAGLDRYYTLDSTEKLDVADCEGLETVEIYTGNMGDGDSGMVLFKDEEGRLLFTQDVHVARAGWGNIYLGETEEGAFIMNVDVEDRWDFGGYSYWVYRLDAEGGIRQIAGSGFDFDFTENSSILYDDELFREWIAGMTPWLENSHLILSSQEGEVRTEKISEADKYNYDTLNLKDRINEIYNAG